MADIKLFLMVFHLSVVIVNSFSIWYDQMYVDLPFPSKDIEALPFKARHIFLTVWCLVLQTIYFAVSFLNDVFGTNAQSPRNPPLIRRTKDVLFSVAFTVAIYVSLAFWTIYSIHKDLIFPHEIESKMPPWMNQVMHTLIIPFIFIELFVVKRNYPSRKLGISLIVSLIFFYTMLVLYLYFTTDVWVYPFMGLLNWTMRFVFVVTSTVIGIEIYTIGEKLNSVVSPTEKLYTNGVNNHVKRH